MKRKCGLPNERGRDSYKLGYLGLGVLLIMEITTHDLGLAQNLLRAPNSSYGGDVSPTLCSAAVRFNVSSLGFRGGIPFPTYGIFYLISIDTSDNTSGVISLDSYPHLWADPPLVASFHASWNTSLSDEWNLRPFVGIGDFSILPTYVFLTIHLGVAVETAVSSHAILFFVLEYPLFVGPRQPYSLLLTCGVRLH
jgi:hypothetical protein